MIINDESMTPEERAAAKKVDKHCMKAISALVREFRESQNRIFPASVLMAIFLERVMHTLNTSIEIEQGINKRKGKPESEDLKAIVVETVFNMIEEAFDIDIVQTETIEDFEPTDRAIH